MDKISLGLPKNEKLKSRKTIETLFAQGDSVSAFPLVLRYIPIESDCHQIAVVAPKKKLRLAVQRNKTKRLLREVYRLHKPALYKILPNPSALVLLYIGKDVPTYAKIEKNYHSLLKKLQQHEEKH